jgi:hypothetical protein
LPPSTKALMSRVRYSERSETQQAPLSHCRKTLLKTPQPAKTFCVNFIDNRFFTYRMTEETIEQARQFHGTHV